MDKEKIITSKGTFVRVSKASARKTYNEGNPIWVVPNHVRFDFDNQWVRPCLLSKRHDTAQDSKDFDRTITNYEWYTCCAELGTYPKFYIKETDKKKFVPKKISMSDKELRETAESQGYSVAWGQGAEEKSQYIDVFDPVDNIRVAQYKIDARGLWQLVSWNLSRVEVQENEKE